MNQPTDDQESRCATPGFDPSTEAIPGLRARAEQALRARADAPLDELSLDDAKRLVHELRVHQIELGIQNEELRRAQAELEASRARYFELYDLAPVGYITLTERGLIHEANLAAAKLLGAPRQELLHRLLSDWVMLDDQDIYYQVRRRLNAARSHQRCELRLRRPDGSGLWVGLALSLEPEHETGCLQCLVVLNNIDAHKRLEALQQEEAKRKEDFLALLGHELRNPLAPIRHIAEVLSSGEGLTPALVASMPEILLRQSGHLARLVDDLLDISRINRGAIRLEKAFCDLRLCTANAVEQIEAPVEARSQRLELALPEEPVVLNGDAVRLTQAIVNLLRNASERSPPASPITVALSAAEGIATVEVRDQGEGLDPESLRVIFDPLQQGHKGHRSRHGGLGMGLALVRRLIELHGGTVEALSPGRGRGSTFRVHLPYQAGRVHEQGKTPSPARPPVRRVLVVEDEPDVATAFVRFLSRLGQEVEWAADGPAALHAVDRFQPDLILLDLGLPGMDGFEVARRLRASERGRAARIVAVSGWGPTHDANSNRKLDFDAHYTKPLGPEVLVALLAADAPPARDDSRNTVAEGSNARPR